VLVIGKRNTANAAHQHTNRDTRIITFPLVPSDTINPKGLFK